jgi:hypothetical protein
MLAQRGTHYWLWFLLFGVVSSIVAVTRQHVLDTESVWLLVTGMLGILLGGLGGRLARPYDLVVGLFFTGIGILGILIISASTWSRRTGPPRMPSTQRLSWG